MRLEIGVGIDGQYKMWLQNVIEISLISSGHGIKKSDFSEEMQASKSRGPSHRYLCHVIKFPDDRLQEWVFTKNFLMYRPFWPPPPPPRVNICHTLWYIHVKTTLLPVSRKWPWWVTPCWLLCQPFPAVTSRWKLLFALCFSFEKTNTCICLSIGFLFCCQLENETNCNVCQACQYGENTQKQNILPCCLRCSNVPGSGESAPFIVKSKSNNGTKSYADRYTFFFLIDAK